MSPGIFRYSVALVITVLTVILGGGCSAQKTAPSEESLLQALCSPDARARIRAAEALCRRDQLAPATVKALLDHRDDPNPEVRTWIIAVLKRVQKPDDAVLSALASALEDSDRLVVWEALVYFARHAPNAPQAVPALRKILLDKEKHYSTPDRTDAARALDKMVPDNKVVVPTLLNMLKDRNASVRSQATATLGILQEPTIEIAKAIASSLRDQDSDVRTSAADALGKIKCQDQQVVRALAAALKDPSQKVQLYAAQSLGDIKSSDEMVLKGLAATLSGTDEKVMVYSLQALGEIGPPAEAVLPSVLDKLTDGSPEVRTFAGQTLHKIGPSLVHLPLLVKAWEKPDFVCQQFMLMCIEHLLERDPRAKERLRALLVPLTKSRDPGLQKRARELLERANKWKGLMNSLT